MLRLVLVASLCAAYVHALAFTDCADPNVNTAVTVHSIDITPMPVVLPGQITFSLNATVNRQIDLLFIDTKLYKEPFAGIFTELPCIGDTNIGSCSNIDACDLITRVTSGSSTIISADLGQQIDAMLANALGHKAGCPIMPESIVIQNEQLTLAALPAGLSLITDGNYKLRVTIKEDPTAPENIGCIEFKASLHATQQPQVGK